MNAAAKRHQGPVKTEADRVPPRWPQHVKRLLACNAFGHRLGRSNATASSRAVAGVSVLSAACARSMALRSSLVIPECVPKQIVNLTGKYWVE